VIPYFLSRQSDGRVVLDRESHGDVLQTIEVTDPPMIEKYVNYDYIDVPHYAVSFEAAMCQITALAWDALHHIAGEGYFVKGMRPEIT
jgi:hypothetical protein